MRHNFSYTLYGYVEKAKVIDKTVRNNLEGLLGYGK